MAVTQIQDGTAGAAPNESIVDEFGAEGDAVWFKLEFTDTVVEKESVELEYRNLDATSISLLDSWT